MRTFAAVLALAISVSMSVVLAGCSTPIRAERVGPDRAYIATNASALTEGEPSEWGRLALHRANLVDVYESDPRTALTALHRRAIVLDRRDNLFALAELSLLTARRERNTDLNLAAAAYAYLYLLGDADQPPPAAFDQRFRLACDIYNRALVEAFRGDDGRWQPREGTFDLPIGRLTVDVPDDAMWLGTQTFYEFRPAMDYEVHGMTGRLRQSGMGAALIAGAPSRKEAAPNEISPGVLVAGSAFLEIVGDLGATESEGLLGVLTLHAPKTTTHLQVRGRTIPLEIDVTTPLAYSLGESRFWDFELGSFLSPDKTDIENGLTMLTPYEPGRIPVVFVHGTASSPARWAEMLNELMSDPVIRRRYTPWLFVYKTSAPILLSASSLRDSLAERVHQLDPDGTDDALRNMIVIGHSQGGLLTRLTVTESGNRFWENASDRPFDELNLPDKQKETLRNALFFEPTPCVARVVFVCAPHRGSFLSEGLLRSIGNMLISIPRRTLALTTMLVTENVDILKPDALRGVPTAVDNMSPGHPFLVALDASPMSPNVPRHSIIAVTDTTPPLTDQDDGVVAYTSAHLDDVESEKVVLSGHSVQGNPECILEVRRILREHIGVVRSVETDD